MEPVNQHQPELEYLLVLDFEATCEENKRLEPCSEIIEFPVIVVDTNHLKTLDIFHQYVKPSYHPKLTNFCTNLTGIEQDKVENANKLEQVLEDFDKWYKGLLYLKEDNHTFLTCGDWDLQNCLRNEAKAKNIIIPNYLKFYINIKKYFGKVIGERTHGMMEMLNTLKLEHEGHHHSGIDDVKNICNICMELIRKCGAMFPKTEIVKLK